MNGRLLAIKPKFPSFRPCKAPRASCTVLFPSPLSYSFTACGEIQKEQLLGVHVRCVLFLYANDKSSLVLWMEKYFRRTIFVRTLRKIADWFGKYQKIAIVDTKVLEYIIHFISFILLSIHNDNIIDWYYQATIFFKVMLLFIACIYTTFELVSNFINIYTTHVVKLVSWRC